MKLRSLFNYDRREASLQTALVCSDGTRTLQSQKEDADINVIVKRFGITGMLPQRNVMPLSEDFSDGVFDFQSALNMLKAAKDSFMSLDADIRARFNNDPARFIKFAEDKENLAELRKMGLALPEVIPVVVPPLEVRVVNPTVEGGD